MQGESGDLPVGDGVTLGRELLESARRRNVIVGAVAVGALSLLAGGGYLCWRRRGGRAGISSVAGKEEGM
jgi:hypothetical protein